jgi:hypothetical protein
LLLCVTKLGRFDRSTRCVRLRKEKQDHALPAEIGERNILTVIGLQPKLWSLIAYLEHQSPQIFIGACLLKAGAADLPPRLRPGHHYNLFY